MNNNVRTCLVVIGTDCTGSCNPTTIRSRLRRTLEEIFDTKSLNRIATIGYGHMREENFNFNGDYIINEM
jgi:hypothetical protein